MKKVTIQKINGNDYVLQDTDGTLYEKNIEIRDGFALNVNDIIYLDDEILKEITLFSFGKLYNDKNVSTKDVIKIVHDNTSYYLQRYYG